MWTLKQTESHYLKEIDIRKNNVRLTDNDYLETRLRYLAEGGLIESVPAVFGSGYMMKKSGNDLFWSNKLRNRLLNFLYISDYSIKDLSRLLRDDPGSVSAVIQKLQNESPSLIQKNNEDEDEDAVLFSITSSGESLTRMHFADIRPTNAESFSQVRIGQIDIQNLETKIDELILQVEKEPNLSEDEMKSFKEKLLNLKNTWIETRQYGQDISPLLTLKAFEELFPKSIL
jgi:DNA-binding MarR family transcriptional regulator